MHNRNLIMTVLVAVATLGVAFSSATERRSGIHSVRAASILSEAARTYQRPRMTMHTPVHTIVRTQNWEIQTTSLTGYRIRTAYNLRRSGSLLHVNFVRPSMGVTLVEVTAVSTAPGYDPADDIRRFFEQLDELTRARS